MATERIDIIVSEKGARVVKRNLEDIGGGADTANRSLNLLKRSLQTLSVGLLARETIRLADAYTTIQNRLKTVTSSTEQLNQVTRDLFAISNRTRSSFQGTAELYARVGLAAKDLGVSQNQLLQFTESLNQAVLLSGASATEANAAIIQLSQGLASGALRGDELRSVMEQLPAVADVIAKGLGVTRGELRKMGEDGKITAQVVLEAFQKARGELADNFGKSVATVGQSIQVLKNNFLKLIGDFDQANGISSSLAKALLAVANNLDLISKALVIGSAAWAAYRIAALSALGTGVVAAIAGNVLAFGQLAAGVRTAAQATALLNATFLIGPGALVAALAAAGAAAYVFRDELRAALTAVITEAIILIDKLSKQLTSLFGLLGKGYSISGLSEEDLRGGADDILLSIKKKQDQEKGIVTNLQQNLPAITGGSPSGAASSEITFDSILQRLKTEGQLLQLNNRERDIQNQMIRVQEQLKRQLTPTEMAYLEAQLQVNQSLEDQAKILDEIRAPAVEYQTSLEALNNLMQQGRINSQEYTQALQDVRLKYLETQTDLASGLERGLLKVNRDLSDAASSMENVVTNAFSNMEDSIVEFAKTGKLNFSSLVDGIISDIIRLQARQAISSIFGGGSGGGGFNLGASILSAVPTFFAKGDVFGSPTAFQYGQGKLGVMGEAGPEAAMPLTRMSDGSLGVRAEGSSQQSVSVTNNVTVNYTASKENGGADSQRVAQMVQQGVEQAMGEFVRKQQKVGGMFNNRVVA